MTVYRAARLIMGLKREHGQSAIALKSLGWMTLVLKSGGLN